MVQAFKDIFGQFVRVREKGSFAQNMSVVCSGTVPSTLQVTFASLISHISVII